MSVILYALISLKINKFVNKKDMTDTFNWEYQIPDKDFLSLNIQLLVKKEKETP